MKVTVVGAGAVGASCAEYIALKNFASEVVLVDIKEGFAEGKAMDLMQTASLNGFDTRIKGVTNDYSQTAGSDVAVITSGIPCKPGMTREELIGTNANIVKSVVEQLVKYSPNVIVIIVSNPMDTMAYLVHKATKLPKNRIIGMGGALDSARFRYRLAEALNSPISDVDGMVIAAHSDSGMLPLTRLATYRGVPVSQFLSEERLAQVSEDTKVGYPYKTFRHFRLVCSRSCCFCLSSSHCLRPKETIPLLCTTRRRIWTKRCLCRGTCDHR